MEITHSILVGWSSFGPSFLDYFSTVVNILDTGSDGYGIGFVSADHIDRIVKLAQIANCDLSVVHPGVETFLV